MEEIPNNIWFTNFNNSLEYKKLSKMPVAYFSAEYALLSNLPTYAGGLGVLAGDIIKEAETNNFPIIGLGLLYKKAQYDLDEKNNQEISPEKAGMTLVKNEQGERILISVPIHQKNVYAEAWKYGKNAPVYFLNTNIQENDIVDRKITERLYTPDREERLKQEILLGVGGLRFLQALNIHPGVYHLNEGHSAFLALELIHHEMKHQHVDFFTACEFAKKHIIFTNHTLVAAGNEQFDTSLVSAMIAKYAEELSVSVAEIISLGVVKDSSIFSMTHLSLNLCHRANAVSKIHAKKAKEIWPEYEMQSITNGVNILRWDGILEEDVLETHNKSKKKLLEFIKEKFEKDWGKNCLLIGWARRIVPYKRPLALFESLEKLNEILKNSSIPVKIIYSGPTHNEDETNNEILEELKEIFENQLKENAVFIPNYNLEKAKLLTGGVDVWLNTPVIGTEACGTSGMKAALCGTLPFSTADGWVAEIKIDDIGWNINEGEVGKNITSTLQEKIIPLFKKHLENPSNSEWKNKMEKSRDLILKNFGSDRMLREYIEKLYIPTLHEKHSHQYN